VLLARNTMHAKNNVTKKILGRFYIKVRRIYPFLFIINCAVE
jgi:hypothetical protein